MQKQHTALLFAACCVAFLAAIAAALPVSAGSREIRIGVLAYRGEEKAYSMWIPTAEYLSRRVPGHRFVIAPLDFHQIGPAVGSGKIDFVITNTSIYVELEARHGVTRIATLKNRRNSHAYTEFGGVIFCRADRPDIRTLKDLDGKSFMAVEETSLGGWRAAWRELHAVGIDPYRDFSSLTFSGTHDTVVYAVRDGKVDSGTVRTDTLERMQEDGLLDLRDFRILNQQPAGRFPYALSTRLYPEWPIAKIRTTPDALAEKVLIALLHMPQDDPAAYAAKIAGWTIPLDYQPVHDLMRELRVGPYRDYGRITLSGAVRAYWRWLLFAGVVLIVAVATAVYVLNLNLRLNQTQTSLRRAREELEEKVIERTSQLSKVNEELEQEIADRIRAEAEKTKLQEQLLQTQKMEAVGILAGGVAHDFNNLLSAIVGYATLIQRRIPESDPLRHHVDQILAASDRAAGLTGSLLAFSRKQVFELKRVNLNSIVCGFERILSRIIGEDIDFTLTCAPGDLIIEADRGQIEQVLMNLATNARDAMPQGGALRITTERVDIDSDEGEIKAGHHAAISFSDTGVGMPKEMQKHVFEPFYTTKEVGKGTGLGLAIVYGIVTKHSGAIHLYSEPGRGTTFRIFLPLVAEQAHDADLPAGAASLEGTETLLLVEDEELVRTATRSLLEEHGYAVIEAFDGEDAVRLFRMNRDRVDLVLCDLVMPRMNGREACDAIQKLRPSVKAVFMSGYTADIIARQGVMEEGIQFVSKPLNPTALLRKLREVLDAEDDGRGKA